MWQLLPLLLWPLVEIALFVVVGGWLGLWPTLAWVVGTAVLGIWLIRRQGERAQIAMRQGLAAMSDPVSPLANGAMTLAAGILLILPGFLTDALGLLLLLPPVRAGLVTLLSRRVVVSGRPWRRNAGQPDIIDGEFIEVDAPPLPRGPVRTSGSGWTEE